MTKIIDSLETDLAVGDRADEASSSAGASLISLARAILASVGAYEGGDILDVLGLLDDTAASGIVTEADTVMQYIKQLITEGIARDAVIGALDDAAASGAVTDADTLIAYMKQTITEGIARDAVIGALDDVAATGAVTEADTLMQYSKQLVTEGIARDTAIGIIDDLFDAPTKDAATDTTIRDAIGRKTDTTATGGISEAKSIMAYAKQLVTELQVLDAIVDAIAAKAVPSAVSKTIAFDGGAGSGGIGTVALFTVTGAVKVKLYAICTETLVGAATLSCGTAGEPTGVIAQIADATGLAVGEIWYDATPTTLLDDDSSIPVKVIGDGADIILTIGAAAITDGTIEFRMEWSPLTADGAVAAA